MRKNTRTKRLQLERETLSVMTEKKLTNEELRLVVGGWTTSTLMSQDVT